MLITGNSDPLYINDLRSTARGAWPTIQKTYHLGARRTIRDARRAIHGARVSGRGERAAENGARRAIQV
jgi:hypothetical protein